jgi:hypothetical protein
LDEYQTEAIWKGNLKYLQEKRPEVVASDSEIIAFARNQFKQQVKIYQVGWNGRQIRNAFQTALALADYDSKILSPDPQNRTKPHLKSEHFEKVVKAALTFDEHLHATLQMIPSTYVNSQRWRNDDYRGPDDFATRDAPAPSAGTPSWGRPTSANTVPMQNGGLGHYGMNAAYAQQPQMHGAFDQAFSMPNSHSIQQPNMSMQNLPQMAMRPNMQLGQANSSMLTGMQTPQGHTMGMNAVQQGQMGPQPTQNLNQQQTGNQQGLGNQATLRQPAGYNMMQSNAMGQVRSGHQAPQQPHMQ